MDDDCICVPCQAGDHEDCRADWCMCIDMDHDVDREEDDLI